VSNKRYLKAFVATLVLIFLICFLMTLPLLAQQSGQSPPSTTQTEQTNTEQPGTVETGESAGSEAPEMNIDGSVMDIIMEEITKPELLIKEQPDNFKLSDFPNDEGGAFLMIWPLTELEKQAAIEQEKIEKKYVNDVKITRREKGLDAVLQVTRDKPTIILEYKYRILHSENPDEFVNGNIPMIEEDTENGISANYKKVDASVVNLGPDRRYKIADSLQTLRIRFWGKANDKDFHAYKLTVPPLPIKDKKTGEDKKDPTGAPEMKIDLEKVHYYQLAMMDKNNNLVYIGKPQSAKAISNPYNILRINNSLIGFLYCVIVLWFIAHARKGKELFIRKIAGLDAVDEAIGRATEMGRPILYLTGMDSMSTVATIAAVNILGQVARKVADYDSQVIVPNRDPIVMSVCQEVVKEAYMDAGRPDAYNPDSIFFLTTDQFSYVAAVDGIMLREKPATNIFMGYYYAEALILAETGGSTGAIQIAGTDALAQLPFFITTCDYTLIGEELYAASAYLAREPLLLGSLKGQDVGKMFLTIMLLLGVILMTISSKFNFISSVFQAD
jgi:hypothetical protein